MSTHHMLPHQLMGAMQTSSYLLYKLFSAVRILVNVKYGTKIGRYLANIWNSYTLREMGMKFMLHFKLYFYNNILKKMVLFLFLETMTEITVIVVQIISWILKHLAKSQFWEWTLLTSKSFLEEMQSSGLMKHYFLFPLWHWNYAFSEHLLSFSLK